MDELPYLVLKEITKYLSVKDLIRCRLVCTNWRSNLTYDDQECLFLHYEAYPTNKKSAFDNRLIGHSNSFQIENIKFIHRHLTRFYFANIRKLIIFKICDPNDEIERCDSNFLEHFKKLAYLELNGLIFNAKLSLNLDELKTLSLKDIFIEQLILNTPKLINLICWINITKLEFIYPNQLEYLEYKNSLSYFDLKFPNLKVLNFFDTNRTLPANFLCNLPNLKKLIFFSSDAELRLEELKKQKLAYNLTQLKLQPFGFEGVLVKQTESIDKYCCCLLYEYYLDSFVLNYSKLVNRITMPVFVDFCSLIDRGIPASFFDKFVNFYIVFVGKEIRDHLKLSDFLQNCGYIYKLVLQNSQLNQLFYNQLYVRSYFDKIKIIEQTKLDVIDFNFLSKLTINELHFELPSLPDQLIRCAFENRYLKNLRFQNQTLKIIIYSNQQNFVLDLNGSIFNSLKNVDQINLTIKNFEDTKKVLI